MKRLVGWALIASPFVTVAGLGIWSVGWETTAAGFGLAALTVGVIRLGVRWAFQ